MPVHFPFINNMDEISYWICTKRAPCLLNYDKLVKKQDDPHCSKSKPKSTYSFPEEVTTPKKKKKRKLSVLDDGSVSMEKQKNVYFEVSQNQKTVMSSCKSDSIGSDIDFNIKNSSVREKSKRPKLQKNNRTTLHKKNKVITSTPITTNLRRSLRRTPKGVNNNSQLNSSFEIFNTCGINDNNVKCSLKLDQQKVAEKLKSELVVTGNQNTEYEVSPIVKEKTKNGTAHNGQFEDLSDVSGFTANYIRSTKIHSTKTPRKLRSKPNRVLIKDSPQANHKEDAMIVCMNKSVNTAAQPETAAVNCSTDSSQNIINLMTVNNNEKPSRVSRSTSLLKFMDPKVNKSKEVTKPETRRQTNQNLNTSFQSKSSSTSRYPKRCRNDPKDSTVTKSAETNKSVVDKRRKISKNSSDFNNSDRKENPQESISRTRSGRSIGLTLRQPDNSVLVLSNSTEQVSSMVSMNVADADTSHTRNNTKRRKCTPTTRNTTRAKKSIDKSGQNLHRNSLRDKSGFTACFSDSDDDSEPLKQRKFFC